MTEIKYSPHMGKLLSTPLCASHSFIHFFSFILYSSFRTLFRKSFYCLESWIGWLAKINIFGCKHCTHYTVKYLPRCWFSSTYHSIRKIQGCNAMKVISKVYAFFVLQCTVFGRKSKHKTNVTAWHGIHFYKNNL